MPKWYIYFATLCAVTTTLAVNRIPTHAVDEVDGTNVYLLSTMLDELRGTVNTNFNTTSNNIDVLTSVVETNAALDDFNSNVGNINVALTSNILHNLLGTNIAYQRFSTNTYALTTNLTAGISNIYDTIDRGDVYTYETATNDAYLAAYELATGTINSNNVNIQTSYSNVIHVVNTNAYASSNNALTANYNAQAISNSVNALAYSIFRSFTNFPGATVPAGGTNFGFSYRWLAQTGVFENVTNTLSLAPVDFGSLIVTWGTNSFYSKNTNNITIGITNGTTLAGLYAQVSALSSYVMRDGSTVTYSFPSGSFVFDDELDVSRLVPPFINASEIVLQGAGVGSTILAMTNMVSDEAVVLVSDIKPKISIRDLTIQNATSHETSGTQTNITWGLACADSYLVVDNITVSNVADAIHVDSNGRLYFDGTNKLYAGHYGICVGTGGYAGEQQTANSVFVNVGYGTSVYGSLLSGFGTTLAYAGAGIVAGENATVRLGYTASCVVTSTPATFSRYAGVYGITLSSIALGKNMTVVGNWLMAVQSASAASVRLSAGTYNNSLATSNAYSCVRSIHDSFLYAYQSSLVTYTGATYCICASDAYVLLDATTNTGGSAISVPVFNVVPTNSTSFIRSL